MQVNNQKTIAEGEKKYKGVQKNGKKWTAQIWIKGTGVKYIGTYDSPEQAHQAYCDYKEQLENNPDKPKKGESHRRLEDESLEDGGNDLQINRWECMNCKKRYQSKIMPARCTPECGSISFNMIG